MNPADTISTLSGVAERRGHEHAERIAGARLGQRWRNSREESLREARAVLADITQDERELDGLALAACKGAARRWRESRRSDRVTR